MRSFRVVTPSLVLLVAALLGGQGCQQNASTSGKSNVGAHSQVMQTDGMSSHLITVQDSDYDVALSTKVVCVSQDVYKTLDADLCDQIKGGKPVSEEDFVRLLSGPNTQVLGDFLTTMFDGEMKCGWLRPANMPSCIINFKPILQSDGSVELYTAAMLSSYGSFLALDSVSDYRVVHPLTRSYEVIKGLNFDDKDVYIFIEVLPACQAPWDTMTLNKVRPKEFAQ